MAERRYSDEEAAAIFEQAAEAEYSTGRRLVPSSGMTLGELQEIGREAGIAPELVARAARSLDRTGGTWSRTLLGIPIGVGRTVELERPMTDAEWERLVVDLRETFDARGRLRQDGTFRQWTNGNLQALVEPLGTGHRVRLKTVKGDATVLIFGGVGFVAVSAGMAALMAMAGRLTDLGALVDVGVFAVIGLGLFGLGAIRLPRWARLRRQQMKEVAERVLLRAEGGSASEPTGGDR